MYGGIGADRGRRAAFGSDVSATCPRRRRTEMSRDGAGSVVGDGPGTAMSQRNPDPEEPESPGVEAGIPYRVHPLPVVIERRGRRTPRRGQRPARWRRRRRPPTPRSGTGTPWRRMAVPAWAVRRTPVRGRRRLPAWTAGAGSGAGTGSARAGSGSAWPTRPTRWRWAARSVTAGSTWSTGGWRSLPTGAGAGAVARLGDRGCRRQSQGGRADPCGQRRTSDQRCRFHQSAPCLELPDAFATVINERGRELRCCCRVAARGPWASPIRESRTAGQVLACRRRGVRAAVTDALPPTSPARSNQTCPSVKPAARTPTGSTHS